MYKDRIFCDKGIIPDDFFQQIQTVVCKIRLQFHVIGQIAAAVIGEEMFESKSVVFSICSYLWLQY